MLEAEARALLAQGLFNDPEIDDLLERFGTRLRDEVDFKEYLLDLASRRARFVISIAMDDERYLDAIAREQYGFLRKKATFQRCMAVAAEEYGWRKKSF